MRENHRVATEKTSPTARDLSTFTCPSKACTDYARRDAGNIKLYTRYGQKQVRLLMCNTCGRTFSEMLGTPLWDARLNFEQVAGIFTALVQGSTIRGASRKRNLSKNTVKRYLRMAMLNPVAVWDFIQPLVAFDYQQYLQMLGGRATDTVQRAPTQPSPTKPRPMKDQTVELAQSFLKSFRWEPPQHAARS